MNKKIAAAVLFVMTTSISIAEPIVTDSTSRSYSDTSSNSTTTIKSPPPAPVMQAPMNFRSPLAEATVMPVYEAGDPTHRNVRND